MYLILLLSLLFTTRGWQRWFQCLQVPLSQVPHGHGQRQRTRRRCRHGGAAQLQGERLCNSILMADTCVDVLKISCDYFMYDKNTQFSPHNLSFAVSLILLQVISSQPIVSFDWSADKEGLCVLSCLDQTLRSYIVTKLNKY